MIASLEPALFRVVVLQVFSLAATDNLVLCVSAPVTGQETHVKANLHLKPGGGSILFRKQNH